MNQAIPPRDPLLVEREKTHGDYKKTAQIFTKLIAVLGDIPIDSRQYLSLIMISLKIARILSGNPMTKDHWDDIAGYAKLGAEACE